MLIEDRLENWGAYMRNKRSPDEVDSKERDYEPGPRIQWEEPGLPEIVTFLTAEERDGNLLDALEIDRAIAGLPIQYAAALEAYYVERLDLGLTLKLMRKVSNFRRPGQGEAVAWLNMAKTLLTKRLELPAVFRQSPDRARPVIRTTSDAETDDY